VLSLVEPGKQVRDLGLEITTLAIDNVYRKFREIWTCGFRDMREDRQIDTQTLYRLPRRYSVAGLASSNTALTY